MNPTLEHQHVAEPHARRRRPRGTARTVALWAGELPAGAEQRSLDRSVAFKSRASAAKKFGFRTGMARAFVFTTPRRSAVLARALDDSQGAEVRAIRRDFAAITEDFDSAVEKLQSEYEFDFRIDDN